MRMINYILADGTQTLSYAKAKASGQKYTTVLVDIPTPRAPLGPIHEGLRVKIG